MINSLGKTDDFIKMINSLSKTDDFIKNINLLNKTNDFIKSEKIKAFPLICSKYLSSWTGLGRSRHVRFPTVGRILNVFGFKICFLTKFLDDSAWLLLEKLKTHYFDKKS